MSLAARFLGPLVAICGLLLAAPSLAVASSETGSLAWTNDDVTLYAGPGTRYDTQGSISSAERVRVDRCQALWCLIHQGRSHGWVRIEDVSFGQGPGFWWEGPRFVSRGSGTGSACFYEGAHYSGRSLCVNSGTAVRDLLLMHRDNVFSSVQLDGGATVLACRDRFFMSFCSNIVESQSRLTGFLDNGLSSFHVY